MLKNYIAFCAIALLCACQPMDTTKVASLKTAPLKNLPVTLSITGGGLNVHKEMVLNELGHGDTGFSFEIKDNTSQNYTLDLNYKALPSNRSYPANLDINFRKGDQKKAYLFFAINDLRALKRMGSIGFMSEVDGEMVDVKFDFHGDTPSTLKVETLGDERFVSDTLIPKKGFQMIRPMLLPSQGGGLRSQSFNLDNHPFEIKYSVVDLEQGGVQFQYNLNRKTEAGSKLAARFYYSAPTLEILREGMFAGKFFDAQYGTIKLVYYPAMGQTMPPQ